MGRESLNKDDQKNVLEHKGLVTNKKQKKKQGNDIIEEENNDDQFMSDTKVDKKEFLKNNTELKIKKKDTIVNDVIDLTIGNDSLMKDWNDGNWSLVVLKDQPFELIDLTESKENVELKHFLRKSKKHKQHKHHPSKLSAFKECLPISNYFRNCFGLEHNMVTSGYKLKDRYRDSLLNFILKNIVT